MQPLDKKLERDVPNTKEIYQYLHCKLCLLESSEIGISPSEYQMIEVGITTLGFQVWCKRHDCNIMHVDFEGQRHPAKYIKESFR